MSSAHSGSWTPEEDQQLREEFSHSVTPRKIKIGGRSRRSVTSRLHKLGLVPPNPHRPWMAEEDEQLRLEFDRCSRIGEIKISGRSTHTIRWRLALLGLFARKKAAERSSPHGLERSGHHLPWTAEESELLRAEVAQGKFASQIAIPGRTRNAVQRQIRELRLRPKSAARPNWSKEEDAELERQMQEGRKPREIIICGRTAGAIRLRLLKRKLTPPIDNHWSAEEIRLLHRLVSNGRRPTTEDLPRRTGAAIQNMLSRLKLTKPRGWTKQEIRRLTTFRLKHPARADNPAIAGRSYRGVTAMAQKLGLTSRERGEASKRGRARAKEILADESRELFFADLHENAFRMTAQELGERWKVGANFIRRWLAAMGLKPTWQDMMNRPGQRERMSRNVKLGKRDAAVVFRRSRLTRLEAMRAELRHAHQKPREQHCLLCEEEWPVGAPFFPPAKQNFPPWRNSVITRVCVACKVRAQLKGRVSVYRISLRRLLVEARQRAIVEQAQRFWNRVVKRRSCKECGRSFPATPRFFPRIKRSSVAESKLTCALCLYSRSEEREAVS